MAQEGTGPQHPDPRDPDPRGGDAPDRTFTFLDRRQAALIRALAQQAFAGWGWEVVIEPDGLVAAGGRIWGLASLMGDCAAWPRGEADWPRLVTRYVARMIALADQPPPEALSRRDVLSRVYLRLIRSSHIPASLRNDFSYVRPVAPGFQRVLALDSPESISVLTDEFVYPFGLGELLVAGMTNLRRVPIGRVERYAGGWREHVYCLTGSSVYTASKLLTLPEVVREVLRVEDHRYGILAGVPTRDRLFVSFVEPATAMAATRSMMQATVDVYHHSPGAISPLVYWWHDGGFSAVSRPAGDGSYLLDHAGPYAPLLAEFLDRHGHR